MVALLFCIVIRIRVAIGWRRYGSIRTRIIIHNSGVVTVVIRPCSGSVIMNGVSITAMIMVSIHIISIIIITWYFSPTPVINPAGDPLRAQGKDPFMELRSRFRKNAPCDKLS